MKHYDKFKEYIWLVNTISHSRHGLTLAELNDEWVKTEMSGGVPMHRNTFQRHKDAIEQMFGLFIECDTHNQCRYYIGNEHVLHSDSLQNWLLQTMTVSNLISESLNMQDRILLEHVATDGRRLQQLIGAMRSSRKIRLQYRPYQAQAARNYTIAPCCLKLCRQRWYLLGGYDNGRYAVFALDRMEKVSLTDDHFTLDPWFDAGDFFSECYGVVVGDGSQAERIVLRAFGREQYAMRDLPLHHTQRLLAEGDGHTDFELTLRPTSDLKAHLLSRGRWLKVLSPEWLADEIRRLHLEAAVAPL